MNEAEKMFFWIEGTLGGGDQGDCRADIWAQSESVEKAEVLIQAYISQEGFRSLQIIAENRLGTLSQIVAQQTEEPPPGFVTMREIQEALNRVAESGGIVALVDYGTRSELLPHRTDSELGLD